MCDDELHKNLHNVLKEIMIMNNKYQIYISGFKNK